MLAHDNTGKRTLIRRGLMPATVLPAAKLLAACRRSAVPPRPRALRQVGIYTGRNLLVVADELIE
jgi:hypothetical protein